MPLSNYQKAVGYLAGVLGALQALVWFILSLFCLIYYYKDEVSIDLQSISFLEAVYLRFLDYLFIDYYYSSYDLIVVPSAFTAYNWVYVVLDFCWFVVCVSQVVEIAKNSKTLHKSIRSFISATLLTLLLDVIFVICIGIDYDKSCVNSKDALNTNLCDKAVVPVLIIAAKGFVLWIMNVIFVYLLRNIAAILRMEALQVGVETWTVTPVTIYSPPPPVNRLVVEETTVIVAQGDSVDSPSGFIVGRETYELRY